MQFVQYLCTLPSNDTYGYIQALPLAKVYVYVANTDGSSGAPAQLYQADGATPASNPVIADINGFAGFAANDGLYNIQVTDAAGERNAPLAVKVQLFDQVGFTEVAEVIGQAVIGPNTSTDAHIPQFDGTTGNKMKDAGLALDTDGTLGANSDTRIPSQKAVATAIAAAQQVKLSGNTTYYVRTDGNDSNTGTMNTSGGAWATIQHALDFIATIDLNTHTATIQVGDGTYSAGASRLTGFNRNGTVILQGNTTTPANCVISVSSGDCLAFTNCVVSILGFKLISTSGSGINAQRSSVFVTGLMEYGACGVGQLTASQSATITISGTGYVISGNAAAHYNIDNSAIVLRSALAVTISGTPSFSQAFVLVQNLGVLNLRNQPTYTGSVTGKRFIVADDSAVSMGNSVTIGPSLNDIFPGTVSGGYATRQDGLRSFRNLLYNSSGIIQEGPSGAVGDGVYGLHNRWYALTQTGGITPQTLLDVADGITHMIELTNTLGSAQRMAYAQVIEGKNCKHLRGADVTLSGFAQRNQSGGFRVALIEWTGAEDSVTKDVVNDWTSSLLTTGNFFVSSNILVDAVGTFNPSTFGVLQNFNLQATLGETFNNLIVIIWATTTATALTGTMDFRMQLEAGRAPTAFERRPMEAEMNLCARYYQAFTIQSESGSRPIQLTRKRVTPSVTVSVGTASAITKDGFELAHSAAAACAVTANAEL